MLLLFFIKLFVAVFIVLILSLIAEYLSPRVAGIISGFPSGTAIIIFFFGLEQSPAFAANSAIYNLVGLSAMLSFFYAYYRVSKHFGILISSLISFISYFIVVYILNMFNFNRLSAVILAIVSVIFFAYLFKKVDNIKIKNKIKLTPFTLGFRAIVAASIIVTVTTLATLMGSKWSGLLSALPTTVFPLSLIIHYTYGPKAVHSILKHVPLGMGSLIAFSLSVSLLFPVIGIYFGTVLSLLIAVLYMLFYRFIIHKLK